LNDRRTNKTYKSNIIQLPQPSLQNLLFNSKTSYPLDISPVDLVSGDFNGDNKTDIVVNGKESKKLMILKGKEDGTFNDAVTMLNNSYSASSLAKGDFNNDNKLDLVLSSDKNIYVAFGKGDGTISITKSVYNIDTVVSCIKVYDFNNDKKSDLLLVNSVEDSVSILNGKGDGTFNVSKNLKVGNYPIDAEIGDFDGDKIPDIITANYNANNLSFIKGNGNGEFQDAIKVGDFYMGLETIEIGDFNKDGIMDVAGIRINNVYVVLGSKTSFGSKTETYDLSLSLTGLTTSDLNQDGSLDIAVVRNGKDICVIRGNGDGTFEVLKEDYYPFYGKTSGGIISDDFNKDSKSDLAMINTGSNNLITFINSYTKSVSTATATSKPTSTATPKPTSTETSKPTSTETSKPTSTATPMITTTSKATSTATAVTTTATSKATSTVMPTNTPVKTDSQPVTNGTSSGAVIPVASPTGTSTTTATSTATPTATPTATATVTPTKASASTQVPTIKPTTVPVEEPSKNLPGSKFISDISKHWAKDKIEELIKQRIISGYLDGTFKPDGEITRAEIATIIVKALKIEPSKGNTAFKDDADIPSWAKPYVKSAFENGIINGYGDGTFKASRSSTREEFVVVMMRAFKFGKSNAELNLKDASEVKAWSKGYVAKAIELGIVKGYKDNTFRPINKITRAEAVVMIIKAQNVKK